MPHSQPLDEDVQLLATIPLQGASPRKNAEEFRIVAKRYHGAEVLDLRTFYQDKQGDWLPTPRGTLLPRSAVHTLKAAVDALCKEASPISATNLSPG